MPLIPRGVLSDRMCRFAEGKTNSIGAAHEPAGLPCLLKGERIDRFPNTGEGARILRGIHGHEDTADTLTDSFRGAQKPSRARSLGNVDARQGRKDAAVPSLALSSRKMRSASASVARAWFTSPAAC